MNIGPKGGCGIIASERNTFAWPFINSLISLKDYMGKDFQMLHCQTGDQAVARNVILQMAKERGLDYVVMIDSDMTFPNFGVEYLLRTMEKFGANIGAGLYFLGMPPYFPTCGDYKGDYKFDFIKEWSKPRYVDGCGMGFTVITKELFDIKFGFENGMGEDYTFCKKATDAGFKIVLEPNVKCGHLRMMEVNENLINKIMT